MRNYDNLWKDFIDKSLTAAERDECYNWFINARKAQGGGFSVKINICSY